MILFNYTGNVPTIEKDLYRKQLSVFTELYRLYKHCWAERDDTMKTISRIIYLLAFIIILPNISLASMPGNTILYGVKIRLSNGIELDGYAEIDYLLNSCHASDFDKINYKLESLEASWDKIRKGIYSGKDSSINFYGKLIQLKRMTADGSVKGFWLASSKSSVKKIKVADIKIIKGVCKEYDGYNTGIGIRLITDYMGEYISKHKMIASYTFNAEDSTLGPEEYAYGRHTTYLSYNPKYPHQKLKKERKIIDKMSEEILDTNKLIRFVWYDD